jgi:hypothetical protein
VSASRPAGCVLPRPASQILRNHVEIGHFAGDVCSQHRIADGVIDSYSFGRAIRNMADRETAEEVLFIEKEGASVTL